MAPSRIVTEFEFSASPASDLVELNRFSYHIPDGDLVFKGQVVEEARRELIEHDHITWFRLLAFDTHNWNAPFVSVGLRLLSRTSHVAAGINAVPIYVLRLRTK